MKFDFLKLIEAHAEKVILAGAGLFLVYMVYAYWIATPHTVKYENQDVGPSGLDRAVLANAERLQTAVRTAKPEAPKIEDYSEQLKQVFARGVWAPGVTQTLARAVPFGQQIQVPGLEAEEAHDTVRLVAPLAPVKLAVRTGRSMAFPTERRLGESEQALPVDDADRQARAVPWVTVAAYFPRAAQQTEMIKAKYPPYRARPYVAGVDVQRRERLPDGNWSEWVDVESKAMPQLEAPEPVIDDATGEILNKDEIDQAFALVKQSQNVLMQPDFYEVETGDIWDIPPLDGLAEEPAEEPEKPREREPAPPRPEPTRQPPTVNRGGPGRTGGTGRAGRSGTDLLDPGPGPGAASGAAAQARERNQARAQAVKDLKAAQRAAQKREFDAARQLIQTVISNADASPNHKRVAERLLAKIERVEKPGSATLVGTARASAQDTALIQHPESREPAVWFHDDTVEGGKTYSYRMRVKLWNRYVGQPRPLVDDEGAKQTLLAGEWSLPSEPITVAPSHYFFVRSPRQGQPVLSVDVWKWRKGSWLKQTFDVGVGDIIGGVRKVSIDDVGADGKESREDVDFSTGAVVLDIRLDEPVRRRESAGRGEFRVRERQSAVLVYLDPADGQVKRRVMEFDKTDPIQAMLEDQTF